MKPIAIILILSGCASVLSGEVSVKQGEWTISTNCLGAALESLLTDKINCGVSAERKF